MVNIKSDERETQMKRALVVFCTVLAVLLTAGGVAQASEVSSLTNEVSALLAKNPGSTRISADTIQFEPGHTATISNVKQRSETVAAIECGVGNYCWYQDINYGGNIERHNYHCSGMVFCFFVVLQYDASSWTNLASFAVETYDGSGFGLYNMSGYSTNAWVGSGANDENNFFHTN